MSTIATGTALARLPTPSRDRFGVLLRRWWQARGTSQLDLALACGTSQRHLSFLESGRARPSRGMVLHLAGALAVPLEQQNALLLAAGYAPAFGPRPADAPDLKPVEAAIDRMLAAHEPFPALSVDRHYTLRKANRGTLALFQALGLIGGSPAANDAAPNLVALILTHPGLRTAVENWTEVASWTIRRMRAEAFLEQPGGETLGWLDAIVGADPALQKLAGPAGAEAGMAAGDGPVLQTRFRLGSVRLSLFTVIASLGTPLDAALQDIRVEMFFPTDAETEAWFRNAAESSSGSAAG